MARYRSEEWENPEFVDWDGYLPREDERQWEDERQFVGVGVPGFGFGFGNPGFGFGGCQPRFGFGFGGCQPRFGFGFGGCRPRF